MGGFNQNSNLKYGVFKTEGATPGTYDAPATAQHVIRVRDLDIQPNIEFDEENSKFANGSHAEDEAIAGQQTVTVTGNVRLTYGGAVTTVPQWWTLMQSIGLMPIGWNAGVETVVGSGVEGISLVSRKAGDCQTYSFVGIDQTIGTSPVYTTYKIAGLMGNCILNGSNGNPVTASFTWQGKLVDIVDGSDIALNAAMQTALAEKYMGVADNFTIGGTAERVSEWQYDFGHVVNPVLNQADATGVEHFYIAERRPRISCNPLAVKQATRDWLNEVLLQTTSPVQIKTTNYTIKGPDCQAMSPAMASREGLNNWDLNFRVLQNGTPGSLADSALTLEDTVDILQGARS